MERAVRESHFVIAVCTPRFAERSDERGGGVDYEGDIMTPVPVPRPRAPVTLPAVRLGAGLPTPPAV